MKNPLIYFSIAVLSLPLFAKGVRGDLVLNGGFETGDFTGWTLDVGTPVTIGNSSNMNPSGPRSGSFLFSASEADGASRGGGSEIAISQEIDLSTFPFINSGNGRFSATAFFSGASGTGSSSDDTALIEIQFYQNGTTGSLLETFQTAAIDPVVGNWNEVSINDGSVPIGADTALYRVRTFLDPGFNSIDIGGDDFTFNVTAVPEPSSAIVLLGVCTCAWLRRRRKLIG
tara:strand:- start:155 stop:841 length:687 start_codon:yes stop_codon:yes gene_type:complete